MYSSWCGSNQTLRPLSWIRTLPWSLTRLVNPCRACHTHFYIHRLSNHFSSEERGLNHKENNSQLHGTSKRSPPFVHSHKGNLQEPSDHHKSNPLYHRHSQNLKKIRVPHNRRGAATASSEVGEVTVSQGACVTGSGPGAAQGDVWTPTLSTAAASTWPLSSSTLIQQPSTLH